MHESEAIVDLTTNEIESISGGLLGHIVCGVVTSLSIRYVLHLAYEYKLFSKDVGQTVKEYVSSVRDHAIIVGKLSFIKEVFLPSGSSKSKPRVLSGSVGFTFKIEGK